MDITPGEPGQRVREQNWIVSCCQRSSGFIHKVKAAVALERAVILNPNDRWSSRLLIATLGQVGRTAEALALIDKAEENWRGYDPLSIRGVTFWYPFKDPADTKRLAEGLRKAGVPD